MVTYIALLIGMVGLFMAWRANRNTADLKERLAQANSRVYNLRREIQQVEQDVEQDRLALKFEILKLKGDLQITPEMRIGEILAVHPQTQQVLAGFHIGGCSSCSVDDRQTLGDAVVANGRPLEPVLAALNTLVAENGGSNRAVSPESLRTPNIELHF